MTRVRKKRGRGTLTPGKGKERRVLLQRTPPLRSRRLARSGFDFKTHPIVRLTENGIDWGAWPEPGDEVGYGMQPYRGDDCMQAAIATCTQVPIEQVPDLALVRRFNHGERPDEISRSSWERVATWAHARGFQIAYSDRVPMPLERWIGVIEHSALLRLVAATRPQGRGPVHPFQGHCLVMRQHELFFDPSCGVRVPGGATGRFEFKPSDISYGIAFTRKET